MHRYKGTSNQKNSIEAYKDFLNILEENGHELRSDYINSSTKVIIDYGCKHGGILKTPNDYKMSNKECKFCRNEQNFLNRIKVNGHELLSEYVDSHKEVLIDFKCGHEPEWRKPKYYKKGSKCKKCPHPQEIRAEKEFKSLLKNNGHTLMSDYINETTEVLIDFGCEHENQYVKPKNYRHYGRRCSKCAKSGLEQGFNTLKKRLRLDSHTLLSEYKGDKYKVLIDFKCGHEPQWIVASSYKKGKSCPVCKSSKGEKEIVRVLNLLEVKFIKEHKFDDLTHIYRPENKTNKNKLRFDFYVPAYNLCIEYDGRQHFEPMDFAGKGEKWALNKLKKQQETDQVKTNYCIDNNIKLLRIPYWEFENIENILKEEFNMRNTA